MTNSEKTTSKEKKILTSSDASLLFFDALFDSINIRLEQTVEYFEGLRDEVKMQEMLESMHVLYGDKKNELEEVCKNLEEAINILDTTKAPDNEIKTHMAHIEKQQDDAIKQELLENLRIQCSKGKSGLEDLKNNKKIADKVLERISDLATQYETLKEKYGNPEHAAETIEILKSVIPKNFIKPNNKLANEITHDFVNFGEQALIVSKANARREIVTKAMLTYAGENISLAKRVEFTAYDREVHDGVVTLYAAGNLKITPTMVYRAMNGMTETEKISPQAIEKVTQSLDKSRFINVSIDYSEEAKARKKNCKATYEGYLLACDKITVTAGGYTQEAYKLLRKPILYDYAQMSGQIISVPISLLQTKDAVRNTDDVIVIRGYLLRQIEGMKSESFKRNNKIAFEGIFSELDMSDLSDKAFSNKALKVRQHVDALLSEWVKQGYIKKYRQYKAGKTIKGISVTI